MLAADQSEPVKPTECRQCDHALSGEDPDPLRHQVIELPPIKPQVTEYQLHRLTCSCCGTTTCASVPEGVSTGQYGPRLQSVLSLVSGAYRLSKRMVETLVEDLFAIPICTGTICNLERQTTEATEPVVQELREYVQTQNGNMDCRLTMRHGKPAIEWSWDGNNEMDAAHGRGWAVIKGNEMHGMIFFHQGNDSEFVARKAKD